MFSLKDFNYIGLDFETTGLDHQVDEPIQIGIIKLDHNFTLIQEFRSYIRPQKSLDQLSETVKRLTGITIEQLVDAPDISQIIDQIQDIIGAGPIYLIGHNIGFDQKFLTKYISNLEIHAIDTCMLAQSLIHYSPSYALDVLGVLPEVHQIFDQMRPNTQAQFHDALYDVRQSLALYRYCYERLNMLMSIYPILISIILKSDDHIWHSILDIHHQDTIDLDFTLPLLIKPIKNRNISQIVAPYKLDLAQKYDINPLKLQDLVLSCLGSPCVIAVSHRSKIDHIRQILNSHGIYTIGYTKPDQIINQHALDQIIHQDQLTEYECDFFIKYCSLHQHGYSLIPSTNQYDQMILHYLAGVPKPTIQPIILCTHQGLYHIIESGEYPDHHLYMFDYDRRYTTYNQYRSIKFDPQYFLNQISIISYKLKFVVSDVILLHKFEHYCSIRVGLFQVACQQYHQTYGNITELGPLSQNPIFEASYTSYHNCKLQYKLIRSSLDDYDCQMLEKYFDHIDQLYTTIVKLIARTYNNQIHYTVDQSITYTDYAEFHDFLHIRQPTSFCLMYTQGCLKMKQENLMGSKIVGQTQTTNHQEIIDLIMKYPKTIVLSNNKFASQKLFQNLITIGVTDQVKCLVENVTGGSGKNIAQLDHHNKICLIGGLEFVHTALSKGRRADYVIAYQIGGPLKHLILQEIVWYNRS